VADQIPDPRQGCCCCLQGSYAFGPMWRTRWELPKIPQFLVNPLQVTPSRQAAMATHRASKSLKHAFFARCCCFVMLATPAALPLGGFRSIFLYAEMVESRVLSSRL